MSSTLATKIAEWLIKAGKVIGETIAARREALAAELDELAAKVRAGELVSDKLLDDAERLHAATKAARDKRPH